MNLNLSLPKVEIPRLKGGAGRGRTVFAVWDRQHIKYLVVSNEKSGLRVHTQDRVEREDGEAPLTQVAKLLKQDQISFGQFVVLLSRAELEMANVDLPPATSGELPALIASQVEEQIGDGEQQPIIDYRLGAFSESEGGEAMAFALEASRLSEYQAQAKGAGARLDAVIPRSLATLGLLRQVPSLKRPLAIAITLFDGEVELMVLQQGQPSTIRTFRGKTDDVTSLAEQVATETQRCLATVDAADDDEGLNLFVFGHREELAPLVDKLVEQIDGTVSLLNPMDSMQLDRAMDRTTCHLFAALAGAAKSYFSTGLSVNLVEPKQVAKPPSPLRRYALFGGVAAVALMAAVYVLAGDLAELRAEVELKQQEFDRKANMARKRQEKADDLRVAERWLQDEVIWLNELRAISSELPNSQAVTLRRLSGRVTPQGSEVNISVQARETADVNSLKDRMRGLAKSVEVRRVAEQGNDEEFPYQFDTKVVLPLQPRPLIDPAEEETELTQDGKESEPAVEQELPVASPTNENEIPDNAEDAS